MSFDWSSALTEQLDRYMNEFLVPRLRGLGDEEYLWEPVVGCWTVRARADGTFSYDFTWPEPSPPPVTTIGWRVNHLAGGIFAMWTNHHFGDRSLDFPDLLIAGTAADGIELLTTAIGEWRRGIASLRAVDFESPRRGPPWENHDARPFAYVAQDANLELIHHGAEIALLRDLFRERGATRH